MRYLNKVTNGTNEIALIGHAFSMNIEISEISRIDILSVFEKYNISTKYAVEIRKKTAFINALKKAKKENILHQIEESETEISYQFDEKFVEESGTIRTAKFNTKAIIRYNKPDDRIFCDDNQVLSLVLELMGITKENYDKMQLAKILYNCIEKETSVTPLRRAGGVYFVPAKYTDFLLKFADMLNEIDPKGDFNLIEIPDLPKSKVTISQAMDEKHVKECALLEEKIDKLISENERISPTIYKNMIEEILQMNKLIETETFIVEQNLNISKEKAKQIKAMAENFFKYGTKFSPLQDPQKELKESVPDIVKDDIYSL